MPFENVTPRKVVKRRGRPPKPAPSDSPSVPPPSITTFTTEDAMLLWYAFKTNGGNPFPDYAELGNVLGISRGAAKLRFYKLKSYFKSVSNSLGGESASPKKGSPVKPKDSKGPKKEIDDWPEDEIQGYFKVSSEEPPTTSIKIEADAVIKPESEDDIKEDCIDI